MAEVLLNFVATSVNDPAGVDSTQTTITVVDGSIFPSVGNYRLMLDSEILLATSVAGDVITVVRGQEGTTATAHKNGSDVSAVMTAGAIVQYVSEH